MPERIFTRSNRYQTEIDDLRKLIAISEEIAEESKQNESDYPNNIKSKLLMIPQGDTLECYYNGLSIISVEEKDGKCKWKSFKKKTYYDDFKSDTEKKLLNIIKNGDVYKNILLNDPESLKMIMKLIGRRDADQMERRIQQSISLNNLSYSENKFSLCGFETKVYGFDKIKNENGDLKYYTYDKNGEIKAIEPEIDMVLFCPNTLKMYLVELKCKDSVVKGKTGVVKHARDYAAVIENDKKLNFTREMIKAYNVMGKLYGSRRFKEFCPDQETLGEISKNLEIVFLFLGSTVTDPAEGFVIEKEKYDDNLTFRTCFLELKKVFLDKTISEKIKGSLYSEFRDDYRGYVFNESNFKEKEKNKKNT